MTAEDNEPRDDESTETEGSDHESADDEGTEGTGSTEGDDRSDDDSDGDDSDADDSDADDSDDDRSEERVKERDEYDDQTPGVTDARPGRDDIGDSQMPSDYHQAVADRPVEVKLPDTPDLSEDASGGDGPSSSGNED